MRASLTSRCGATILVMLELLLSAGPWRSDLERFRDMLCALCSNAVPIYAERLQRFIDLFIKTPQINISVLPGAAVA